MSCATVVSVAPGSVVQTADWVFDSDVGEPEGVIGLQLLETVGSETNGEFKSPNQYVVTGARTITCSYSFPVTNAQRWQVIEPLDITTPALCAGQVGMTPYAPAVNPWRRRESLGAWPEARFEETT